MAEELTGARREGSPAARRGEDPLTGVVGLRDTINCLFEDFFSGRPFFVGGDGSAGKAWTPAVDICESDREVLVYVAIPGVRKEDCRLEVRGSTLVLSGWCEEPAGEGRQWAHHEVPCGSFRRALSLPGDVNSDDVEASCRDGILEIRLPKAESVRAKTVAIE